MVSILCNGCSGVACRPRQPVPAGTLCRKWNDGRSISSLGRGTSMSSASANGAERYSGSKCLVRSARKTSQCAMNKVGVRHENSSKQTVDDCCDCWLAGSSFRPCALLARVWAIACCMVGRENLTNEASTKKLMEQISERGGVLWRFNKENLLVISNLPDGNGPR